MTGGLATLVVVGVCSVAIAPASAFAAIAEHSGQRDRRHRTTISERYCARVLSNEPSDTPLVQTLARSDLTRASVVDVSLGSPTTLHDPFVISCAFTDSNANALRDGDEPISVRVVRLQGDVDHITYRQQMDLDPATSICVLSIVLNRRAPRELLTSDTTCIVDPAVVVPESPMVALLGATGLGTLGAIGLLLRRRRPVAA